MLSSMKIAILHQEVIPTLFLLEKAAKKVGFEPHVFHFGDLRFGTDKNGIYVCAGKISLKNFDLIFCRGFWDYQNEVALLSEFCRARGIPLFDSALKTVHTISKMHDLFRFQSAGLPVPKTLFPHGKTYAASIARELGFPIVAKEDRSRQGKEIHLLKNEKELQKFLALTASKQKNLATFSYEFQEFIPADFDVRVLVIGGKVVGAIERRSPIPGEFRHNVSLGAVAREIEISPTMKRQALKAASVLRYEFAGVDFITNKNTGKAYLLEVNRSPGFEGFMKATGIDVPMRLMNFFKLKNKLHSQKILLQYRTKL